MSEEAVKTCCYCDATDGLEEYDGEMYCEDCAPSHWCTICEKWNHTDELCSHLFLSGGDVYGAGAEYISEYGYLFLRASLFALLDKTGMAADLLASLRAHTYEIYEVSGPWGGAWVKCYINGVPWGDRWTEDAEENWDFEEWAERIRPGGCWLLSLEAEKTDEADEQTATWVEEYLSLDESGKAYYQLYHQNEWQFNSLTNAVRKGISEDEIRRRVSELDAQSVERSQEKDLILAALPYFFKSEG